MGKQARINAKLKANSKIGGDVVHMNDNTYNDMEFVTNKKVVNDVGGLFTRLDACGSTIACHKEGVTALEVYFGISNTPTFAMNTKLGIGYFIGKQTFKPVLKEWFLCAVGSDNQSELKVSFVSDRKPTLIQALGLITSAVMRMIDHSPKFANDVDKFFRWIIIYGQAIVNGSIPRNRIEQDCGSLVSVFDANAFNGTTFALLPEYN